MLRKLFLFLLIVLAIGGWLGYDKYQSIFAPNVPNELARPFLVIPSGSNYDDVFATLKNQQLIVDEQAFDWVAEQMSFKQKKEMRSGRFKIEPGWSNRRLIQHLRTGKQAPVKVVLNNERLPAEVAGKVAKVIETDSASIHQLFLDEKFLENYKVEPQEAMTLLIPNTYEFYWDQSAEEFFDRMYKEYKNFWNKNKRIKKATDMGLSQQEVYTLASIVERESLKKDERPRIAGVYLNRLKKNMLLQADPTVVFATQDFNTRRVTFKHLEIDSPYNTYKYTGLPPGPISMASISSIDAVLANEAHDYIFFCAKGDGSGYHAFAKSLSGHNANAARYRKNLRARGLR